MTLRQFKRSSRIAEQILREVSGFVDSELAHKMTCMITFTQVRVSTDLRYATIYYSYLGENQDSGAVEQFLDREKKRVRQYVGHRLNIRFIPELIFKFDPSVREGIRIEQLLNEIKDDSK